MNIQIAPSNPNIVYVMVEADSVRGARPQRLLSGLYRSMDAGRTWKWMSTIDNRPLYFSQIRVDPRNPNRVYRMAVDFQFSDDGGYSWRSGMLGNHEDYHAMWIDPNDPEHYIIGGDAGIFQTWDKGGTYDAINNMAMGQFYIVSYDYQVPYRVCGGLQDNGSSCGLSRRRNGQLQMTDWFAVNAADGLYTQQDPIDPNIIYYESQGGNITRRNIATGEVANIRARTVTVSQFGQQIAQIKGDGTKPLTPEQEKQIADLRARMKRELADPNVATRWNWNTPFLLSVHDHNVFYSGAEKVFKSVKQGSEPRAISPDLTAHDPTWIRVAEGYDADGNLAADGSGGITRDATGAEENATIVTLAESPIRAGLLGVGTDDGKVWITRDDGAHWEDLTSRISGVPPMTHVSRVELSPSDTATIYVSFDNHRTGDFKPYLFVSNDFGKTFRQIPLALDPSRPSSVYVVREDPYNANLLYIGTELGTYASLDKGAHWFHLANGLPTVPVYDLQVHPRDRELIAATHGRGVMILDVSPLEQMTSVALSQPVALFQPTIAYQYSQPPAPSETRAQRPWKVDGGPDGAVISYRLATTPASAPRIMIVNAAGDTVATMTGEQKAGLNSVTWNFIEGAPGGAGAGRGAGAGGRGGRGAASGPVNVSGFPPGFEPRPAESRAAPDTSGSPTAPQAQGGRGGGRGGGGGGGFGRGNVRNADTGDFRVVLQVDGRNYTQVLRVVRVAPGQVSIMP
jgi:hypothetical protein